MTDTVETNAASPPSPDPASPAPADPVRRSGFWSGLLFIAIVVFAMGNTWLGYDAQQSLIVDQNALTQVNDDLLMLRRLEILTLDAETGQRGYILTREASYREPYDLAVEQLSAAILELGERMGSYGPSMVGRFAALEFAIAAKTSELQRTVQYAEENNFDAATRIISEDRGQQYMDNIRSASDAIEAALTEQALLLRAERDRNQRRARWAMFVAAVGSIILLALLVRMVRRDASRKEEIYDLVMRRNEFLDAAVRERTEALQAANTQLDRSNRELENFAYVVSHDLQEPLRKIRAFSDRLKTTYAGQIEPQAVDYIGRMNSAAERMSTLLSDLLAFSRVNTRGLEIVEIDMNELVDVVLEDLELAIDRVAARVVRDTLPTIRGDQTQIRQLFQNLISNALKFQPEGQTPEVRIGFEAIESKAPREADGTAGSTDDAPEPAERAEKLAPVLARFSISDNGIGFEERYLDRIFDPFARLHGRTEFPGSGIGLAICRRVAERHGGALTARSTPGEGSTFFVDLPFEPDVENGLYHFSEGS